MKNYLLIFSFILVAILQVVGQNSDFQVASISPIPFNMPLGTPGDVYIEVANSGANIPPGGIRVHMSVTGQLDLTNPIIFSDGNCYNQGSIWTVTFAQRIGANTEYVMINTNGIMYDGMSCELRAHFVSTGVSCLNCGVCTVNASFTETSGMGDLNGFNNSAVGYFTVTQRLPIKLGDFDAIVNDCKSINVSWNTYSEENFDKAEIEKSFDGKKFVTIASVKSKGNGTTVNNSYKYTDNEPLKKGIVYYRLKTIDNDKSYSYSRVVTADVNCEVGADIEIFPNPTHGLTNVKFNGLKLGGLRNVLILDGKGDVVKKVNMDVEIINPLNVSELPSGVYILKLVDDTNVIQKKFVKIN